MNKPNKFAPDVRDRTVLLAAGASGIPVAMGGPVVEGWRMFGCTT
jgi:hypothetical protein